MHIFPSFNLFFWFWGSFLNCIQIVFSFLLEKDACLFLLYSKCGWRETVCGQLVQEKGLVFSGQVHSENAKEKKRLRVCASRAVYNLKNCDHHWQHSFIFWSTWSWVVNPLTHCITIYITNYTLFACKTVIFLLFL